MTSRNKMKEAKKEAGLCLHDGCGSKALTPPVFDYCEKHLAEDPRARVKRKKTPPSN
jgi:hypothetical protein